MIHEVKRGHYAYLHILHKAKDPHNKTMLILMDSYKMHKSYSHLGFCTQSQIKMYK